MLNNGVCPVIYEKGSLGASGELTPIAHMVLVMIGGGEVYYKGVTLKESDAMKRAGINSVELVEKEGIVLINGIQVITLIMALVVYDAVNLMK